MKKRLLPPAVFILAIVALDAAVKTLVVANLKQVGSVVLLPGVFALTYAENTGAAFSILSGSQWFLTAVRVVGILAILWFLWKGTFRHPVGVVAAAAVVGGGIGNLIDLIRYGYVVDMFEFLFVRFAIFNVADCFITGGVVLLAVYILFFHDRGEKKEGLKEPHEQEDHADAK